MGFNARAVMLASAAGGKTQKPFGYAILSLKPRNSATATTRTQPTGDKPGVLAWAEMVLTVANGLAVSVSEHDRAIDHAVVALRNFARKFPAWRSDLND
jgi:hypothetical protein